MPTAAAGVGASTELQKSIFNAPPSAVPAGTTANTAAPAVNGYNGVPQGVKRPRDEESDEGEAPMEEDDSDAPMDASSDEDD